MLKKIAFTKAETYEPQKEWKRTSLCNEESISIEHFIKPAGHSSPKHEHPADQVLVVLEGKIGVETDVEKVELLQGDAVFIPGGESHIVHNPEVSPAVGLDIFVPGRSFDFWLKRGLSEEK